MKQKIYTLLLVPLIAFLGSGMLGPKVHADDVAAVDNGSGSTNTVTANESSQTSIVATNNSSTSNTVIANADTGGNSANANNGTTNVTTGEAQSNTTISNGSNTNAVVTDCGCSTGSDQNVTVSENGSGSTNNASVANASTTNVTTTNNATITNNVKGTVNTGGNVSSGNNGNTSITTGAIQVLTNISNAYNTNFVSLGAPKDEDTNITISGNGVGSANSVNMKNANFVSVNVLNNAHVLNDVLYDLNTGGNSANANIGNVAILTGGIVAKTSITNAGNKNVVEIGKCNEVPTPSNPSAPVAPPTTTTTTNPGPSNPTPGGPGNPTSQAVLAAAVGAILPATGVNWLFFALFGNIVMLFMGFYLRLRSGRSPSVSSITL